MMSKNLLFVSISMEYYVGSPWQPRVLSETLFGDSLLGTLAFHVCYNNRISLPLKDTVRLVAQSFQFIFTHHCLLLYSNPNHIGTLRSVAFSP